jgi:hypothetical protein
MPRYDSTVTVDTLALDTVATARTVVLTDYVGRLSNPSKMPGTAYGIPAAHCITGTKLRSVEGSTCSHCYAHERGAYAWPVVKAAYQRRFDTLGKPYWVEAMAEILNRKRGRRAGFHRWHDAGDLMSIEHLANICRVAELTPTVKHWCPTREYRIVADYMRQGGIIPANLNLRASAHMIGGQVPSFGHMTVSSVSDEHGRYPDAWECPARNQGNACGPCRACWDTDVEHVTYPVH